MSCKALRRMSKEVAQGWLQWCYGLRTAFTLLSAVWEGFGVDSGLLGGPLPGKVKLALKLGCLAQKKCIGLTPNKYPLFVRLRSSHLHPSDFLRGLGSVHSYLLCRPPEPPSHLSLEDGSLGGWVCLISWLGPCIPRPLASQHWFPVGFQIFGECCQFLEFHANLPRGIQTQALF